MQAEFIESAFKRRIKIILHLIKSTFRFAGQSHYQKCCRKGKIYTSTLKRCDKEGKEDKFQNLGSFRPPTGDSWQKSILRVHQQTPNLFLVYLQHQQEKYLCGRWNRECTLHVEHPQIFRYYCSSLAKGIIPLAQRNAVENSSVLQRYNTTFHQGTSCRLLLQVLLHVTPASVCLL